MLASHKVLLPYIRNEPEVIEMLRDQNGAKSTAGIRWLAKFGFLFRQMLLRQTALAQVVRLVWAA